MEPVVTERVPAALWARAIAFFIDLFLAWVLFMGGLIAPLIWAFVYGRPGDKVPPYLGMVVLGASFATFLGYLLLRDCLVRGRSLGKLLLGLRVESNAESGRVSFLACALRNVSLIVPLGVLGEAGIVLLSEDRARLGDRLAKTRVVKARGG